MLRSAGFSNVGFRSIPFDETFVRNCSRSTIESLANILVKLGGVGDLVLFPDDYIRVDIERNECVILFRYIPPLWNHESD